MKEKLINKLFNEFEKDKEIIKRNIKEVMEVIHLEVEDEYGKLTLTIKYERKNDK